MSNVEDNVLKIKNQVTKFIPSPTPQQIPVSTAKALKERLQWGEPALTIIDVRDRGVFNQEHITGAESIPVAELSKKASESLDLDRDLYVYGDAQQETTDAAAQLREAGFTKVSELEGGLEAWKKVSGPTEGQMA